MSILEILGSVEIRSDDRSLNFVFVGQCRMLILRISDSLFRTSYQKDRIYRCGQKACGIWGMFTLAAIAKTCAV